MRAMAVNCSSGPARLHPANITTRIRCVPLSSALMLQRGSMGDPVGVSLGSCASCAGRRDVVPQGTTLLPASKPRSNLH